MRLVASIIPLLLLVACTDEPDVAPPTVAAPVVTPIVSATPPLLGVVAARTSEVVAAQVDGRIIHVVATSGKPVHAGEVIAEIDPTLIAEHLRAAVAAVDAAHAELAGAQGEVSEAQRQMELERKLFRAGAAAEENVRVARANLVRASATAVRIAASVREAEATRATIEAQLARTHLVAPIDGVVSLVKARVGEVVAPGVVIAHVFDPAHLMIRFQVPHDRRRDIVVHTTVELRVGGLQAALAGEVTSVSTDLEPPLDFAVAEANLRDVAVAGEIQIGTLGDVSVK